MGVRLMVEVLDHWRDHGLTAGERGDLLIVAENANDQSRETYGSIHKPYVLRRAGKSAAGWKNALGKLMRKGVLAYAVHDGRELSGFPGQHAVYWVPILCPDPPHDGQQGQCTRERVTSQVTQSEETGHPSGDPNKDLGHRSGVNGSPHSTERVTSQVTPTPLTPHDSSSLSPAERVIRDADVVVEGEERDFARWLEKSHKINGLGWYRYIATNGDLEVHAKTWQAEREATQARAAKLDARRAAQTEAQAAKRAAIEACDYCDRAGIRRDHFTDCDHQTPLDPKIDQRPSDLAGIKAEMKALKMRTEAEKRAQVQPQGSGLSPLQELMQRTANREEGRT